MSQSEGVRVPAESALGVAPRVSCAACGAELGPALLACPACAALVHRDALTQVAARAEAATRLENYSEALAEWRRALTLLPADSRQHRQITEIIQTLSQRAGGPSSVSAGAQGAPLLDPAKARTPNSEVKGERSRKSLWAVIASTASLLLLKFKSLFMLLLGAAKPLALGLTKLGTVGSMLLSLGFYWAAFGWKLAVGFIACIYVHEIGHVVALRQLGIAASAPMFVPGLGAFVRFKQYPVDAREDARVGLAGPRWGLGASLIALAAAFAFRSGALFAIAELSAWVNLFNLMPVWSLDGSRGLRALKPSERRLLALALGAACLLTHNPLLGLIAAVALWRSFEPSQESGSTKILLEFLLIALLLTSVMVVATSMSPKRLF